jgi:dTDP-L-rhamnose 4-epimerase
VDAEGRPATPLAADAATTHTNPSSVYGSTKLAQELVLRNWAASFSVPLSVFRLQNVYGPGQSPHNPYTGIITLFHRLASRGETLDVYEDGGINRDFVYIDDVVSALSAGLDRLPDSGGPRVLDVGNGVVTSIHDAARMIAAHHGAPEPVVSGKFRDGDVRSAWADITATRAALDWSPAWSFRDGSAAVSDWLKRGGFLG